MTKKRATPSPLFVLFYLLGVYIQGGLQSCEAFITPLRSQSGRHVVAVSPTRRFVSSPTDSSNTVPPEEQLRNEIEAMRNEALKRMEALNKQVASLPSGGQNCTGGSSSSVLDQANSKEESIEAARTTTATNTPSTSTAPSLETKQNVKALLANFTAMNSEALVSYEKREKGRRARAVARRDQVSGTALLDGTRWKASISVGRQPKTWMPEEWGKSGERLNMHMLLDFSDEQLYEREDFLGGLADSKVLQVTELATGPTLSEGARAVKVKKTGGWRIDSGKGLAETDLLRFYVDVEEEVVKNDVSCPKGRVYFTCSYFPMSTLSELNEGGITLQQQYDYMTKRYNGLNTKQEKDNELISFKKLKRLYDIMDAESQLRKLKTRIEQERVRKPERSLLRLSKDGKVGLLREGVLCCKVTKGFGTLEEYHVLGKFGVGALDKPEEPSSKAAKTLRP